MALSTTTTISIKVPDQEFDYIRLVVDSTTTIKEIKKEVMDQLFETSPKWTKRRMAFRSRPRERDETPCHFMQQWTIDEVMKVGFTEFELVYTDLMQ